MSPALADAPPPIVYATGNSSLGLMLLALNPRGLFMVQFGEAETDLHVPFQRAYPTALHTTFDTVTQSDWYTPYAQAIEACIHGQPFSPALPLDTCQGTPFQQKVWASLRQIPHGELRTYTQIAASIGHPTAVRAAASACGANNLAVIIPCHRVIRSNGHLGGYRWGLGVKRALLEREGMIRTNPLQSVHALAMS